MEVEETLATSFRLFTLFLYTEALAQREEDEDNGEEGSDEGDDRDEKGEQRQGLLAVSPTSAGEEEREDLLLRSGAEVESMGWKNGGLKVSQGHTT